MKLYVENLPYTMNNDQLYGLFARYGKVESAEVMTNLSTGGSLGAGLVEMPSLRECGDAILELDGTPLGGRILKVRAARRPKRSREEQTLRASRAVEAGCPHDSRQDGAAAAF